MKEQRNLKTVLKYNKMSQEELAEIIGMAIRSLSKKINGKTDFKLFEEAKVIADMFGYTVDELFFNENNLKMRLYNNKNGHNLNSDT